MIPRYFAAGVITRRRKGRFEFLVEDVEYRDGCRDIKFPGGMEEAVDSGNPRKTLREELEEETGRLRRENERLQRRVETADRILGVASGLLRGRMDRGARHERAPKKPATEDE